MQNNCHCADKSSTCSDPEDGGAERCTRGDVAAVVDLGFKSLKVGGGMDAMIVSTLLAFSPQHRVTVALQSCNGRLPSGRQLWDGEEHLALR